MPVTLCAASVERDPFGAVVDLGEPEPMHPGEIRSDVGFRKAALDQGSARACGCSLH
jgi:hypothetical protein